MCNVRSPLFSFILKSLFIGNSYLSWYCCFVLFVFLQKFKNMVDLHNVSFSPQTDLRPTFRATRTVFSPLL